MEHQIVNLGQVAALIISVDEPNTKTVFWYDIGEGEDNAIVKYWNGKGWVPFEELDVKINHINTKINEDNEIINDDDVGKGLLCKLPESNANSGENILFRTIRNNSSRIHIMDSDDGISFGWTNFVGVLVDSEYKAIVSSQKAVIATYIS